MNPQIRQILTEIAEAAHEANRAYALSLGEEIPSWAQAPEWQRKSAVSGVTFILYSPESTPENSHESWLKEKEKDGWKYAPVKDAEKKEHPCFVPYSELPAEQRFKDHLFQAVVKTLLRQRGLIL